ncbi:MAG: response regulator [Planctomycetota bacterium]|nr:MAG: response regulator [Planctomycetota bacterium]
MGPNVEDERRVMLIDDDGVCLAMLARGLRRRGFAVSTFKDPGEALRALRTERPDAVVTDMRMPLVSGLDVVREVRLQLGEEAPPVLVVSAEGGEGTLQEAFRLGAADYLLKPVSEAELYVKLSRSLQRAPARRPEQAIPERLDAWTLHERLGHGGTACVFRARRDEEPETDCALKVIWPHLTASTETLLRFRREIDTLASLEHPQLVRFVASGRDAGLTYYAMSYLPWGTLRERVRAQGAAAPREVLSFLSSLSAPLGYLHERGIVHRDVKPGNVFLHPERGYVLGDFGLARRLFDRGITLADEFIGTPLYLAPEVFRTNEFGITVDFYALGVCALEWLLGEPLLAEEDSVRLIGRLVEEGLPAPRELLPRLPPRLVSFLERLVAPDPAARPQSAGELAEQAREVSAAVG